MMRWSIPAKTFLLGEYAALDDRGAIILTTEPCFDLSLTDTPGLHGIHPDSPAGQWWALHGHADVGLLWHDPLNQCGGMGASSAQFIGTFLAVAYLNQTQPTSDEMLEAYWQCAWQGQGLRPSGYDVIAQSLSGCVSIHRREQRVEVLPWSFSDLAFVIAHTGNKLATHHHLQQTLLVDDVAQLDALVSKAHHALITADSQAMVEAVNAYHQALMQMQRVDPHTQDLIAKLQDKPGILAIKGCGAMGADVLLCITHRQDVAVVRERLSAMNLNILATQENLRL